jgi:polysaccharide deacetylase family protein (PEP-CTERM system associated)
MIPHALSFDIEDWYQGFLYRGITGWEHHGSREEGTVERVLSLLDEYKTSATFFVLGKLAEKQPGIIRSISQAGHEIASHTYSHIPVPRLTPATFREDLRRSIATLESITGDKVLGYRAASWSVRSDCLWALDILAEEGVEYDSSIFPTRLHSYGIPEFPTFPQRLHLASGQSILEFPAQVLPVGWLRLPAAGGFYLRAFPYALSAYALRRSERHAHSGMVYVHPYDLDADIPRIKVPVSFRIIRYYHLGKTETYLRRLLSVFKFRPIRDLSGSITASVSLAKFG